MITRSTAFCLKFWIWRGTEKLDACQSRKKCGDSPRVVNRERVCSNFRSAGERCSNGFPNELRCVPDYYLIMTGTCPSGHVITEAATCEAAATAFSMSDTTVTSSSSTWSGRPEGCVFSLSTSSYGSDTLYLQTAASSYDSCTSSKYCLCMPPYGETAPPSPNPTPSPTSPTPIPTPDGYGAKMCLTRSENRWYFWSEVFHSSIS